MANETLSIRKNQARLTVVGKSKADTYIDSGLGLDLGDLPSLNLDPFDLNWQTDVPDPDNLPDWIQIISPPYKTEYRSGEKVDLTGILVKAYQGSSVWNDTTGRYQDGIIPVQELFPSPQIIRYPTYPSSAKTASFQIETYRTMYGGGWIRRNYNGVFTSNQAAAFFYSDALSQNGVYLVLAYLGPENPPDPFSLIVDHVNESGHEYDQDLSNERGYSKQSFGFYRRVGDTILRLNFGNSPVFIKDQIVSTTVPFIHSEEETAPEIADALLFGRTFPITITWKRPADGVELTNSFYVSSYVGN